MPYTYTSEVAKYGITQAIVNQLVVSKVGYT